MPPYQHPDSARAGAPVATPDDPHVTILMGLFNGARHLDAQLQSFEAQTHRNWDLLVSDDGSHDDSRAMLEAFAARHRGAHRVTCLAGPGQGAAANFLSLLKEAPKHIPPGGWIAFSDQDDVWLPERLSRGIAALHSIAPDIPALYCSRTWITGEDLQKKRLSPRHRRGPSFRNALVQNIAAGNTILMNGAGSRLVCALSAGVDQVVMHDWWAYQVITGVGGQVLHDDAPTLLYRQHAANVLGENAGLRANRNRLSALANGGYRRWNDINARALAKAAPHFTPENQAAFAAFAALRQAGPLGRLIGLGRLRPYRQTRIGTLALWVAALTNRL